MHRFFISRDNVNNDLVTIDGKQVYQIRNVLRLKLGDHIIVLDNTGLEYEINIKSLANNTVQGQILRKKRATGEPKTRLTLYQALLKVDKFELVLQKGTELGISDFVPFFSKRCIARQPSDSKLERWQNIIREAAEQSHRGCLPTLHQAISFEKACELANKPAVILWEEEKKQSLAKILRSTPFSRIEAISIFIGPEGGFEQSEIGLAKEYGIVPAGLGKRILRAETAGLVAVSTIMYEKGEFN